MRVEIPIKALVQILPVPAGQTRHTQGLQKIRSQQEPVRLTADPLQAKVRAIRGLQAAAQVTADHPQTVLAATPGHRAADQATAALHAVQEAEATAVDPALQ